jgi:hypothetical protein
MWYNYIENIDNLIENSLKRAQKFSMNELEK